MAEKSAFGNLLKHYRQAAGLTQEALAERARISPRAVSDLERGINKIPRSATLNLLVEALRLSETQSNLLRAAARPGAGFSPPDAPARLPRFTLPVPPTRLIGRDAEQAQAVNWLRSGKTRLLSLIGPSGVGKTRLALQLAGELAADFPEGVVFVPLEHERDPNHLPEALAQALGLQEAPGVPIPEQVAASLQAKTTLLVLDNLEQILDSSPFIAALLAGCLRLAILATSRSPLRLRAEQELWLRPLPLADAIELFRERAEAIKPGLEPSPDEIVSICEQLDCLPLAVELAATQVRLFSLPELHRRLAHRFSLLRGGARDLPARQQTMEAALAWSYDLLTGQQQGIFRALGVFVNGWTLEAAEAVCRNEDDGVREDLLLDLSALVEASLVQIEGQIWGGLRFAMFGLMREFALDRLQAAGELGRVQRRHAEVFAQLADRAMAIFEAGQTPPDLSLARELPNVVAALEWAESHQEAEIGLRLCGFSRLWYVSGRPIQAADWLARMLALDSRVRENGGPVAPLTIRIEKLYSLGRVLLALGQMEPAGAAAKEALELARQTGDQEGVSSAWATLGMIAQAQGKLDEAEQAFSLAAQSASQAGDERLRFRALFNLGELARGRKDFGRASDYLEQALTAAQSQGMSWDTAMVTTLLGRLAYQQHDYPLAKARFHASLDLLTAFNSPTYLAWCLEGCAAVLVAEGKAHPAARLCAAASQMRKLAGTPLPEQEADAFEQVLARVRDQLGQAAFEQDWKIGAGLSQEEVVRLARE